MTTNSVLTQIPDNINLLQPTKFIFTVPNLPFLNYYCQSVVFPGFSTSEVPVPTPFSATYRHGDTMQFDPLSLTFLIDEDMRVVEETFQWLSVLTNPTQFKEYAPKFKEKYYDGVLIMNKNSNTTNFRVKFYNCHPVSFGSFQLSTTDTPSSTMIADLTFRYDYFKFERI